MKKALLTFGVGTHANLLSVSRPLFQSYARRHQYAYIEPESIDTERPPSWAKVTELLKLLREYESVLWLDCDVVIVNGQDDIAGQVPAEAWQAIVAHHGARGEVPNCGVWFVRQAMTATLQRLWRMEEYVRHPWWEQGAMHELLGYKDDASGVLRPVESTELFRHTHLLPLAWNSDPYHDRDECPRFVHLPAQPLWRRKMIMQLLARESVAG